MGRANLQELLGPLGKLPKVWCEVLFVDPVSDIAVLGTPETQEATNQADAYDALVNAVEAIPVIALQYDRKVLREAQPGGGRFSGPLLDWPRAKADTWLLSLDRRWIKCRINARHRALAITDAAETIKPGMSGSPVLTRGGAVGVVCAGGSHGSGPQPVLAGCLPGWLLREVCP